MLVQESSYIKVKKEKCSSDSYSVFIECGTLSQTVFSIMLAKSREKSLKKDNSYV